MSHFSPHHILMLLCCRLIPFIVCYFRLFEFKGGRVVRLKKISLLGFKSFAEKTVLHFDAGITCIVGPNGCGKSNISDAFRWVLGEQSAKSMRGNKMPDVIFAGTTSRKPLNFAEVSLTLTDIQDALSIDYEEITITRRLHRSGDSDYLLNGNAVRLKDLQTLFLGSGIGKNAFSIFEQGKLDQIISETPQERRHIFEEAAGILRFLQRKKEALKKLEQADLNLCRVRDIHLEVQKQIQTLDNQAKKARLYKEQKGMLDSLEKASYVMRWQGIEKKQTDLKSTFFEQKKRENKCLESLTESRVDVQKTQERSQLYEKCLRTQSEKLFTLRAQQDILQHENQSLEQRQKETQLREKKLKQTLEDLSLARQIRQKTLKEINRKREALETDWSEAQSEWIEQQDRVKLQEKEVRRLRQDVFAKQQDHLNHLHQNHSLQSELKQTEVRLDNLNRHQQLLEAQIEKLGSDFLHLDQTAKEKTDQLHQLSGLVDSHRDRLEQFEEDLKIAAFELEKKQQDMQMIGRTVIEMKARRKVLLKMREELEGFSSGSKTLLLESQNPARSFYQKLRPFYEFFDPKGEEAAPLAVVLRTYSHTLVVETDKDAKNVLAFAEQENLQDYSLLCMEWIGKIRRERLTTQHALIKSVTSNPVSKHFLEVIAVSSLHENMLDSWIRGGCEEEWNVQGIFFDHRAVLFKIKPSENQVFIRESELTSLETQISIKENLLETLEQAFHHLQHRRSHLQLERSERDKILRRDEMKLVEVNFNLQKALHDQEKNRSDQTRCQQDLITLKQRVADHTQAFDRLDQQCEKVNHQVIELEQEHEMLRQELITQEQALNIQESDQKEKGAMYQQLAESRQQMVHQQNLLEAKELDHDKTVVRIEDELDELSDLQAQFLQDKKRVEQKIEIIENEVKEASGQYADLEKQGANVLKESEEAKIRLTLLQEELKKIEYELAQLNVQLAHQQAISEAVTQELRERYHLTIEDALQCPLPFNGSLDQTERQIKSLRQAIQESGDVNLSAIEDLEKHQLRYHFLKEQIDDMELSKKELLTMIEQLDGQSHQLFKDTFEAIRTNFQKNFQILFEGGEADLQFTDSEDILEAGIEITAKPPGKQMRSITLLSGGEKCLTAVALLFAIFEVKPAPFCILDEIDAPLDDTNVERFVNVVKHFVDRCQFLIITHNKRTMAIGDTIFGVSMEEKGISKLLSLAFAHKEVPEASIIS